MKNAHDQQAHSARVGDVSRCKRSPTHTKQRYPRR